jgi:DNA-binding NarL/FixJ family response regulator
MKQHGDRGLTARGRNLVLIADRSAHFRETVRRVLARFPDCQVVGEADSLTRAVRMARRLDPDIALLEIDLVLNQQASRLRRLAESFPRLRIIVMLNEESADYRRAVDERWGHTCIVKDSLEVDILRLLGPKGRLSAPAGR